ncbi:MAG TPA: transketolase [Candidatus Dormibacteraeota bacterium]|nr:transketolase [Candidatus Dormibacteraeota bacterium]
MSAAIRPATDVELHALARRLRAHSLRMISQAKTSHIGSCLSVADVMAVLYGSVLRFDARKPKWAGRDRLVMSKGHAAAVTYAAVAEAGFIPFERLDEYAHNGGQLYGHVTSVGVPGVELSSGSLGHGLPVGAGMALAGKRDKASWRVFVVMSDGEMDEGSNWEAILFAGHHGLDNLVAIIDYNKIQSLDAVEKTLRLEPLAGKFEAFGWATIEVDGHDIPAVHEALRSVPLEKGKPSVVIAHTIKGKGVSWMEGKVIWHYRPPAPGEELEAALAEVGGA